jgi:putative inorganic carbon (HCO3(-)) transporter
MEIWSRAIYGIQDFPFTGMGMNTFRKIVPVLYPLFIISPATDIGHAHNEFLQAALDLGIPGVIAFISLYVVAFWMLIRIWMFGRVGAQSIFNGNAALDSRLAPMGKPSTLDLSPLGDIRLVKIALLGLGGGLFAHMIWGMTDAMALGARPAFLLWIVLGLISGLHQQAQEQAEVNGINNSTQEANH